MRPLEKPGVIPTKWYYKPAWIFVAVLTAGPFALPLVWKSPELKLWHKVAITTGLIAITIWLAKATVDIYQSLLKQMKEIQSMYQ